MTSNRDETLSPTDGNIPATVQITKSMNMKRKNDSIPKQHDKEDLGFLDDRIQLLDTVRSDKRYLHSESSRLVQALRFLQRFHKLLNNY